MNDGRCKLALFYMDHGVLLQQFFFGQNIPCNFLICTK